MDQALRRRIKKIEVLVLDVDGVLTDGRINYDSDGREIKLFNVLDGYGVVLLRRAGLRTAILSARSCPAVTVRARDMKIDRVYQDAYPKIGVYETLLKDFSVTDEQVCFVGDDLPDLAVLKRAGFAATVANATAEVKKVAHYVARRPGGQGAVREIVELILKTQNRWAEIVRVHGS